MNKYRSKTFGILNGLDYSIWNPEADNYIAKKFSSRDRSGKLECKKQLQELCGFPLQKDVPVLGIVSRLAEQKGFDILAQAIDDICHMQVQVVILGTGDLKYHNLLEDMVKKFPKTISLHLKFDDQLAHRIYAGSDIFLMPSKYEPCGLGQLISLKYGTIPVVFKTGGLADTINDDNGFIFDVYSSDELLLTIKRAARLYRNTKEWDALVKRAMKCDFSWGESARQYIRLYEKASALK